MWTPHSALPCAMHSTIVRSFDPPPSYLDVLLDPGEYFLQVDGYAGAEGQWFLDIFEAEP